MFSVSRGSCTLSQPITNHQGADGVRHSHHYVKTSNSHQTPTREVCRGNVPGRDFLCPPVLEDLLHQFWRGLQDNLPAREELNKILEFQGDELRWTPQSGLGGLIWLQLNEFASCYIVSIANIASIGGESHEQGK